MGYVTVGKPKNAGGGIYRGAANPATAPSDMTADMSTFSGFTSLGHISEDGITGGISRTSETIKSWGGAIVLTTETGKEDTFKFTLIDVLKPDVQKVVYGDTNVTTTTQSSRTLTTVKSNAKELENHSYVIEEILSDGSLQRTYIPDAKVTDIGEVKHTDGSAIGYEVTVTAIADANGDTFTKWILSAA